MPPSGHDLFRYVASYSHAIEQMRLTAELPSVQPDDDNDIDTILHAYEATCLESGTDHGRFDKPVKLDCVQTNSDLSEVLLSTPTIMPPYTRTSSHRRVFVKTLDRSSFEANGFFLCDSSPLARPVQEINKESTSPSVEPCVDATLETDFPVISALLAKRTRGSLASRACACTQTEPDAHENAEKGAISLEDVAVAAEPGWYPEWQTLCVPKPGREPDALERNEMECSMLSTYVAISQTNFSGYSSVPAPLPNLNGFPGFARRPRPTHREVPSNTAFASCLNVSTSEQKGLMRKRTDWHVRLSLRRTIAMPHSIHSECVRFWLKNASAHITRAEGLWELAKRYHAIRKAALCLLAWQAYLAQKGRQLSRAK
ncbi:hypothetical protein BC830DRAFT_1111493 [Chytriomyces sp. MP71]|nr:hypothetical protein BC830DRAFT_1111493 [Chytriomyces sp. MP71]